MSNLPESNTWETVYQLETTDPVLGGTTGATNVPLKNLTNRTKYLKTLLDAIIAGTTGLVGKLLSGSTVANSYIAQQSDTAVASTAFVQNEIARMGRKNSIINGDMRVAQRGDTFAVNSGDEKFTLDRWLVKCAGSSRTGTITQDQDVLRGDIAETWAAMKGVFSAASGDIFIKQRIPNVMQFADGKCVLSFAFHSNCDFMMDILLSQYLSNTGFSSGDKWHDMQSVQILTGFGYYSLVFEPESMVAMSIGDLDEDNCLEVMFNIHEATALEFWMTEVQLERGEIPSIFDQRNDTYECLKFYEEKKVDEKIQVNGIGSSHSHWGHTYFSHKRKEPTITPTSMHYTNLQSSYVLTQIDNNSYMWQVDEPSATTAGWVIIEVSGIILIEAEIV